ncbi:MAG: PVC-type heme-binding CxxCH protein [Balneolales bacterium]
MSISKIPFIIGFFAVIGATAFFAMRNTEKPLGETCLTLSANLAGNAGHEAEEVDYGRYQHLKTPPLHPEEALERFELEEGFRIELVASEPMITDPVAMDIDSDGRLWVVDMPTFMPVHDRSESETIPLQQVPEARLVVLEDTNGDGKMDSHRVFYDDLIMPRSVKVLKDGVLVGEPPNVWFIQDTNGDGKGDTREKVYSSYGNPKIDNIQNMPNNMMWGMDNWLHSSHDNVESIRLIDGEWQTRPFKRLGQWGMNQDDWGRLYSANNSNPLQTHLPPYGYSERHPLFQVNTGKNQNMAPTAPMWPAHATGVNRGYRVGNVVREDGTLKKATATTGPVIYRGDQFGDEYRGNAFVPEPAGNLIKRYLIDSDPAEIDFEVSFAYDGREFLTSTDERFRPINMFNSPDGSLYVIDMYRGLFETALSLTDHLRDYLVEHDLHKPVGNFGRIYRIVREDHEIEYNTPHFSSMLPSQAVEYLKHENGELRDQAQQVLVQCSPENVVSTLEKWVLAESTEAYTRLQALWTLEGFDRKTYPQDRLEQITISALDDDHPRIRSSAVRILEPAIAQGVSGILERLEKLAETEPSPFVNLQLLASLGESANDDDQALYLMADILNDHSDSPYFREMALTGLYQREEQMAEILQTNYGWNEELSEQEEFLSTLKGAEAELNRQVNQDHLSDKEKELYNLGEQHFRSCMACHGPEGQGMSGIGTRLNGSRWVQGDPEALVRIVLHGFSSDFATRGITISGVMPSHDYLSDKEIAGILTFIRQSWNNDAPPIEAEEVGQIRKATSERNTEWSPDELREVID